MRVPATALLVACVVSTAVADEHSIAQVVDRQIAARWKSLGIAPAAQSDDEEFIRRIHLDLTGMIPTAESVSRFLEDSAPDKRQVWIDRLAQSPEFDLQLARVLDSMLVERRIHEIRSYDIPTKDWREFLAEAIHDDTPWDRLVARILAADGSDPKTKAALRFYLARSVQPHDLTRDIGRVLLGRDLSCAQCHDDPRYKDYTQKEYYGIYAFLSRTTFYRDTKSNISLLSEKADGAVIYESVFTGMKGASGPQLLGRERFAEPTIEKGREYIVPPAKGLRSVPTYSRRLLMAKELPRPETVGFTRNIVNRLWAQFMGRGLIHPLDLDQSLNPPSHPELLDELARRFEGMKYDLRGFVRELLRSRTYQLSSRLASNHAAPPPEAFAVASLRPLSPDQFAWSVLQATGRLATATAAAEKRLRARDPATYAQTVASFAWKRALYSELEREAGALAAPFQGPAGTHEGNFEPTVHQAMFLLNGPALTKWFQSPKNGMLFESLINEKSPESLADLLYRSILSRRPTADETGDVRQYLEEIRDRPQAVKDLAMALLLSAEFRLNH